MNTATKVAYQDLLHLKEWYDVTVCFNNALNLSYLVAQESPESLKNIVFACRHEEELSHAQLLSLFDSLSPPGDLNMYENGLLLAIVGNSSTVVYHRLLAGAHNILPNTRKKSSAI